VRAIDTNVIVRLIAEDNLSQVEIAERLALEPFMILPTVLLESVWVLEKSYRMSRDEVNARLCDLLGNVNAVVVSAEAVDWALDQYRQGMDFADALHLALADEANADQFSTFDQGISKTVHEPRVPIETLS
jgi:predicted nucleic-acid-binding protein